jgi:hypothetical protein
MSMQTVVSAYNYDLLHGKNNSAIGLLSERKVLTCTTDYNRQK